MVQFSPWFPYSIHVVMIVTKSVVNGFDFGPLGIKLNGTLNSGPVQTKLWSQASSKVTILSLKRKLVPPFQKALKNLLVKINVIFVFYHSNKSFFILIVQYLTCRGTGFLQDTRTMGEVATLRHFSPLPKTKENLKILRIISLQSKV